MSRRPKVPDVSAGKITPNRNAPFFRVYEPLLYSAAFLKLTPTAKIIYIAMGLSAKGKTEFSFPFSAYSRITSKHGFEKAKEQLVKAGFIREVKRYRTLPTVYALSSDWMKKTVL